MRRDSLSEITDEDLAHYAATEAVRALSKAEEYMHNMDMESVWEFFGDLDGKYQTQLMEAIRDEDEHELGSVFMEALREHAKDATR